MQIAFGRVRRKKSHDYELTLKVKVDEPVSPKNIEKRN